MLTHAGGRRPSSTLLLGPRFVSVDLHHRGASGAEDRTGRRLVGGLRWRRGDRDRAGFRRRRLGGTVGVRVAPRRAEANDLEPRPLVREGRPGLVAPGLTTRAKLRLEARNSILEQILLALKLVDLVL